MRNFSIIILCGAFVIAQYARQVSYWECRLANYFRPDNIKCDCERLVEELTDDAKTGTPLVWHNHAHLDDLYDTTCPSASNANAGNFRTYNGIFLPILSEGTSEQPDRPPRRVWSFM